MSTLLLRLAAPLQSWGGDSKFERRPTGRTPTKSGVIGICAAALGYRRWEDQKLERLKSLGFGVRIDREGSLLRDFQMAHEEPFWDPSDRSKVNRGKSGSSHLSNRYYLADAVFLAALEGHETLLMEIDEAIHYPMFPLFLGRRSCPPEGRLTLGIVPDPLCSALEKHPILAKPPKMSSSPYELRVVVDADKYSDAKARKGGYLSHDIPISYNRQHRIHDYRRVNEYSVSVLAVDTNHDALASLEEATLCT